MNAEAFRIFAFIWLSIIGGCAIGVMLNSKYIANDVHKIRKAVTEKTHDDE